MFARLSRSADQWMGARRPRCDPLREAGMTKIVAAQFPLFLSLSKYLTGEPGLDRKLAQRHFSRLRSASDPAALAKLLVQWQAAQKNHAQTDRLVRKILADPVLGPLAKTLMLLWYTGGIKGVVGNTTLWTIETAADYFGALAWKVVGSHPPGLSNQFFGHWKYPTEF
jgi:Membrane bound FAD containing D-sorbitol dehydrogenase